MKIYFDNVDFNSRTGPNSFVTRLARALANRGHVIADHGDYDVALCLIEKTHRLNNRKPFVQRLDGIWFKPEEIKTRNVNIKKTFDEATAVVFQSEFNKKQITGWWGHKEISSVIHNGVDPHEVEAAQITAKINVDELRTRFEKIFVCSSNWHSQKRFIDNVRLFAHLRKTYPFSCLLVMGSNPPINQIGSAGIENNIINNIYFTYNQPHDVCLKVYKEADYFFHLAWLDHCPNVVCEALACGTPVVCSSDGGTAELVKEYGVILRDSIEYDYQPTNYDNPPQIDVTQIDVLPDFDDKTRQNAQQRMNINFIAQQYENILSRFV